MSLFACQNCICVENTATSNYWMRGNAQALCSECDPEIGAWHGKFPKRSAVGMLVGRDGFLYVEPPKHIEVLGIVQ